MSRHISALVFALYSPIRKAAASHPPLSRSSPSNPHVLSVTGFVPEYAHPLPPPPSRNIGQLGADISASWLQHGAFLPSTRISYSFCFPPVLAWHERISYDRRPFAIGGWTKSYREPVDTERIIVSNIQSHPIHFWPIAARKCRSGLLLLNILPSNTQPAAIVYAPVYSLTPLQLHFPSLLASFCLVRKRSLRTAALALPSLLILPRLVSALVALLLSERIWCWMLGTTTLTTTVSPVLPFFQLLQRRLAAASRMSIRVLLAPSHRPFPNPTPPSLLYASPQQVSDLPVRPPCHAHPSLHTLYSSSFLLFFFRGLSRLLVCQSVGPLAVADL